MSRSSRLCALFKQNSTGSVTPSLSKSGRAGGAASRNETTELSQGAASAATARGACTARLTGPRPQEHRAGLSFVVRGRRAEDPSPPCTPRGRARLGMRCVEALVPRPPRPHLRARSARARGAQSSVAPSEAPSTVSETPSRWLPDDLRDQMRCARPPLPRPRALARRSAVP